MIQKKASVSLVLGMVLALGTAIPVSAQTVPQPRTGSGTSGGGAREGSDQYDFLSTVVTAVEGSLGKEHPTSLAFKDVLSKVSIVVLPHRPILGDGVYQAVEDDDGGELLKKSWVRRDAISDPDSQHLWIWDGATKDVALLIHELCVLARIENSDQYGISRPIYNRLAPYYQVSDDGWMPTFAGAWSCKTKGLPVARSISVRDSMFVAGPVSGGPEPVGHTLSWSERTRGKAGPYEIDMAVVVRNQDMYAGFKNASVQATGEERWDGGSFKGYGTAEADATVEFISWTRIRITRPALYREWDGDWYDYMFMPDRVIVDECSR